MAHELEFFLDNSLLYRSLCNCDTLQGMNKYILPLLLFITFPALANQRFECNSNVAAIVSESGDFDQFQISGMREDNGSLSYVQLRYNKLKNRDTAAESVYPVEPILSGNPVYSLLDGQDHSIAFALDVGTYAIIRNQGQYISTEQLHCRFSR